MKSFTSLFLMLVLLAGSAPFALAVPDEGMFMLDQIGKIPLAPRGSRLKPTDIYNPNGGGLSDAIVRVNIGTGGHGTGEFISGQGLILTNHHVGFDGLVAASTAGNDLAEKGYAAQSMKDELVAKDYTVLLTQRVENVTAKVLAGVTDGMAAETRKATIDKNLAELEKAEKAKAAGSDIRIVAMNNGYFYYLFQTMTLKDVRIVYAPPKSIGFFGGDPDNFEWTRHTGDFTFMRAYVGPDGKPAEYSPNNVPFKPKRHLTISLAGVKENDLSLVMGYPGTTTRYREHQSVAYNQNIRFPFLVRWFNANISSLEAVGAEDPEKKVKLQGDIASFANGEKAFRGGAVAMKRGAAVAKRKADEAVFSKWVNANPQRKAKYGEVLSAFAKTYEEFDKVSRHDILVPRFVTASPLLNFVAQAANSAAEGKQYSEAELGKIRETLTNAFAEREMAAEAVLLKFYLREAADLPVGQKIEAVEKIFGGMNGAARVKAEEEFVKSALTSGRFNSIEAMLDFYKGTVANVRADNEEFVQLATALVKENMAAQARVQKFNAEFNRLRLLFIQGMSEMRGKTPYPDANGTLRFSLGNVKGYKPRESVTYTPFTTLKGVIEKDSDVFPFDAPQKLVDLQNSRDFGRYGVGDSVPVNFLTTNDIIGGNSGSPILNAAGEQVGIVFDGNYEGLGNDFFVSDELGRTIAVDIRYVLFVTEKFGGVNWFFKEMNIKGGMARTAGR